MNAPQVPIAIIGAGPAGLTLARLLELANIDYIVFERDESAEWADEHSSSGTLDIHKDLGQVALEAAGLLEKFQSVARYNVPIRIADAGGSVHAHIPGDGNQDKPEIDRKDLRKLLIGCIPASKICWGYKVQHIQVEHDASVSVHATDCRVESGFQLVVGADGAWSKVRKLLTSTVPQYSGTCFFTTFIKPDDPAYPLVTSTAEDGNYLAMSKGRQIFLHYLGDRSYHLAVGVKLLKNSTSGSAVVYDSSNLWQSLLRDEFAGWTQGLTEMINSNSRTFRSWPLYSMPENPVPWQHIPGLTLLGDAAHLTVPTGDGVNNALYDSLELARLIAKHKANSLDLAVLEYEKAMLPRAADAFKKGEWFTKHFFGANAPQDFLQAIGMQK